MIFRCERCHSRAFEMQLVKDDDEEGGHYECQDREACDDRRVRLEQVVKSATEGLKTPPLEQTESQARMMAILDNGAKASFERCAKCFLGERVRVGFSMSMALTNAGPQPIPASLEGVLSGVTADCVVLTSFGGKSMLIPREKMMWLEIV